ncbi:hypothetical protein P691DRAFT_767370 [Macrolepiota fuliginosa MF-IS2]|uniref:Uncharacterized protein n=1 Tax=Macrolepiota fuliginosa MF-IS2 TaxID=1400762 RepID=A0A9P5WZP9_9AGAR|nr:hypothetical protein P691DRAFT_767370 [Macrolepiota fuliginosa MF-IS2]
MVKTANTALAHAKSTFWVDSACFTPCGITCATANVPSTSDLNIIEATLTGGLLGAHICIPASRSFIKIVDVPFFKPSMTKPIPSTEVGAQLQCSIIPSNYIVHWRFMWNSPKAEFTTVWIDLSNLQQGTRASQLIGHHLFLNRVEVLIKGAKAHTGMPQYNHRCPYWQHCFNRSWIQDWAIQDASAHKNIPPPPPTLRSNKPPPHDHTLHPPQQGAPQPSLPPIHEDDEGDDNNMAPFGLALDDDYDFHK